MTPGSSFEQTMIGRSPQCYIPSFVEIGPSVPEKNFEEFLPYMGMAAMYEHDLGPRLRNDLDHQYSHTFINSIRCLLLLLFSSLAAIISEKSTVFTFSYRKP